MSRDMRNSMKVQLYMFGATLKELLQTVFFRDLKLMKIATAVFCSRVGFTI